MGGKGLGKYWLGRKCCLFAFSLCLGQQKTLNSNLKNFGPQPQKSFVWCHVGDNVRDAWEKNGWRNTGLKGSVAFLYSVCAWVSKGISAQNLKIGSAKEFKLKTSRASSPTHKKHFVWCHVRGNVRDIWGKKGWGNIGLGGSAVFLHSVCAWVSKRT